MRARDPATQMSGPLLVVGSLLLSTLLTPRPAQGAGEAEDPEAEETQPAEPETTEDRPTHQESAARQGPAAEPAVESPALPAGKTLDEVLDAAAEGPPPGAVKTVPDHRVYAFWLFDQLEARATTVGEVHAGWEDIGWLGGPVDRLWWKNEGEWLPADGHAGEMETDLLYGRLVTPFWTAQAGLRYASGWAPGAYEDAWSAALALQGLVPGKVELDASVYLSEALHLSGEVEAEYDVRLTQRLVLQPRLGLGLSLQDVPEENVGRGLSRADLDLRLRYAIVRELAPYLGLRGTLATGPTARMLRADGEPASRFLLVGGARVAL